jgi:hypothetical protein
MSMKGFTKTAVNRHRDIRHLSRRCSGGMMGERQTGMMGKSVAGA